MSIGLDTDGCARNGEQAFNQIAGDLANSGPCFFAWTDGRGTQYDILMTRVSDWNFYGRPQGGLVGGELFVAIMSKGAWGFRVGERVHPNYVGEKLLGERPPVPSDAVRPTAFALSQLINGVMERL